MLLVMVTLITPNFVGDNKKVYSFGCFYLKKAKQATKLKFLNTVECLNEVNTCISTGNTILSVIRKRLYNVRNMNEVAASAASLSIHRFVSKKSEKNKAKRINKKKNVVSKLLITFFYPKFVQETYLLKEKEKFNCHHYGNENDSTVFFKRKVKVNIKRKSCDSQLVKLYFHRFLYWAWAVHFNNIFLYRFSIRLIGKYSSYIHEFARNKVDRAFRKQI